MIEKWLEIKITVSLFNTFRFILNIYSRLPYKEEPRRVVYETAPSVTPDPVKNLVVQWLPTQATIKKSKRLKLGLFCSVGC